MATLERTRLLIIDDWGPEPLTAEQRRDMLEIVDDRYEKGSLLITSQIPIGDGMKSSRTPRSGTRSWTASFTAHTGSSSRAPACASGTMPRSAPQSAQA